MNLHMLIQHLNSSSTSASTSSSNIQMQKTVQEIKFVQKRDKIKTVCQTQTEPQPNHRERRRSKHRQYSIDDALPYTPETVPIFFLANILYVTCSSFIQWFHSSYNWLQLLWLVQFISLKSWNPKKVAWEAKTVWTMWMVVMNLEWLI